MKVYMVWYDNCEMYEDNFQYPDAFCSTYDGAVKFLEDKGYVSTVDKRYDMFVGEFVEMPVWTIPEPDCDKNCCDCDKYVKCEWSDYCNPEWTIHEIEVLE